MFIWDFLFLFLISVSLPLLFFFFSFFSFLKFYLFFYKAGPKAAVEYWTKYSSFLEQIFPCPSFPTAFGNHLKSSTACELGLDLKALAPTSTCFHTAQMLTAELQLFPSSWLTSHWTLWFVLLADPMTAVQGPIPCVREHWKGVGALPLPGAGLDFAFLAFMFLVHFCVLLRWRGGTA